MNVVCEYVITADILHLKDKITCIFAPSTGHYQIIYLLQRIYDFFFFKQRIYSFISFRNVTVVWFSIKHTYFYSCIKAFLNQK